MQELERQQQNDADLADGQFRDLEQALETERTQKQAFEAELGAALTVSQQYCVALIA
jgi:hypothetical protein